MIRFSIITLLVLSACVETVPDRDGVEDTDAVDNGGSDNGGTGNGSDDGSENEDEFLELCVQLDDAYEGATLYVANWDSEHWNNDQWFDGSGDPVTVDDDPFLCGPLTFLVFDGDYMEVNGEYEDGWLVENGGGFADVHIVKMWLGPEEVDFMVVSNGVGGYDVGFQVGFAGL